MSKIIKTNSVKKRMLFLSPSVKEGLEKECSKDDFYLEDGKSVGKGGFGEVWKVRHNTTQKLYVIKVMNKENIRKQKMEDQINREVEIMYKLNHPHIIKLYNHFEDDDNLYLIMDFASKGQLYSLLKKEGKFDEKSVAQYMREVISAIKYLQSVKPPIIHRDIKPENILLDEDGRVKLADFGWSNYVKKKDEGRFTYCGTPEYLAPEMIKKEGHSFEVDIWALGVLMFELLTGFPPFVGNESELFNNIENLKINWTDDFPSVAKNLINKILKVNPKDRLSLNDILKHPWFEANPAIRPILPVKQLDQKELIESFLINPKSDSNKDEMINNIINNRKNCFSQIFKKINIRPTQNNFNENYKGSIVSSSDSIISSSSVTSSNCNVTTNFSNANIGTAIINTNIVNNVTTSITKDKKRISELTELNEKLKKENTELKKKSEKNESEIKSLKTENQKLKDINVQFQDKEYIESIKDELEKCKLLRNDTTELKNEIEKKNKEVLTLTEKLKEYENEKEISKKKENDLNAQLLDMQNKKDILDNQVNSLKEEINKTVVSKDKLIQEYTEKIEMLRINIINEINSSDNSNVITNNILGILNDTINEMKELFTKKAQNWENTINNFKENFQSTQNEIKDILNVYENKLNQNFTNFNASITEGFKKISAVFTTSETNKINERLEWQKKQINELMPFKIKSTDLENQISKYESENKIFADKINTMTINLKICEKLIQEKNDSLLEKKSYIKLLEQKFADVKDYIFREFPDNLDEFNKWINFKDKRK